MTINKMLVLEREHLASDALTLMMIWQQVEMVFDVNQGDQACYKKISGTSL